MPTIEPRIVTAVPRNCFTLRLMRARIHQTGGGHPRIWELFKMRRLLVAVTLGVALLATSFVTSPTVETAEATHTHICKDVVDYRLETNWVWSVQRGFYRVTSWQPYMKVDCTPVSHASMGWTAVFTTTGGVATVISGVGCVSGNFWLCPVAAAGFGAYVYGGTRLGAIQTQPYQNGAVSSTYTPPVQSTYTPARNNQTSIQQGIIGGGAYGFGGGCC